MTQLTLFDVPETQRPKRRTTPAEGATRWTKYNQAAALKPHPCDYCILNCHEDVMAPAPRRARYVRQTVWDKFYLCVPHANDQRAEDGLAPLKG